MKIRNPILGVALALALLPWSLATGSAQMDHERMMRQDTTRAGRMMSGQMTPDMMATCGRMMGMMGQRMMDMMMGGSMMGPDMMDAGMMGGMMGGGMMGQGMRGTMGGGMMGGGMMGHGMMAGMFSPQFLLALKDELDLTDDQVTRLEAIQGDLQQAVQGQAQKLRELHGSLAEAREKNDWSELESGIDQATKLHADVAKAQVEAARRTLAVLSDEQRQKLESWRQGAMMYQQGTQRMMHHTRQGTGSGNRP